MAHTNFDDLFVCCVILKSLKFQATLVFFSKIKKWTFHSDCIFRSIFLYLSKVIFKISCIILYNIDLHNCEQIFTHLHLNLSGKAFKVGVQHFSSVSDTLNGLKIHADKNKKPQPKTAIETLRWKNCDVYFFSRFCAISVHAFSWNARKSY